MEINILSNVPICSYSLINEMNIKKFPWHSKVRLDSFYVLRRQTSRSYQFCIDDKLIPGNEFVLYYTSIPGITPNYTVIKNLIPIVGNRYSTVCVDPSVG